MVAVADRVAEVRRRNSEIQGNPPPDLGGYDLHQCQSVFICGFNVFKLLHSGQARRNRLAVPGILETLFCES